MMTIGKNNIFLYLTLPLAMLVAISAACGIFTAHTYAAETENWRIQGIGQDIFDLFIVVPLLTISGIAAYYNNKTAAFIFAGTVLFLIYSYAIYCFALHFNYLFLVYCFTFGLSVYSFVWVILLHTAAVIRGWFDDSAPVNWLSGFLLFTAAIFYFLWLSDILPAIAGGRAPSSLIGTGMLTNPVHVLDLSLVLPGFVITAIFLLRQKPAGYLLMPVAYVFTVLMAINIAVLMVFMKIKQVSNDLPVAIIMVGFAISALLFLIYFMKHLRKGAVGFNYYYHEIYT